MVVGVTSEGNRIIAWDAQREGAAFYCPVCEDRVTLRKGNIRIHHFAHRAGAECPNAGESMLHLEIKRSLFLALREYEGCSRCGLERVLPDVRPDLSLVIRGTPVAIEVQVSSIQETEITRRFLAYTDLGIHCLWITARDDIAAWPQEERGTTREWERFLHSLYRRRVYYWKCGAMVIPVRFSFGEYKRKAHLGFLRDGPGGVKNATKRSLHIVRDFVPGKAFISAGGPRVLTWRDRMSGSWTVTPQAWGW